MSFKKIATSTIVTASLLAANLSPLAASAANAHDGWRRHDDDRGYSRSYDGPRHRYSDRYDDRRRDRHSGRNIAKGLAIGLGILAVGSILASESHR
jgi:hypothetical protein